MHCHASLIYLKDFSLWTIILSGLLAPILIEYFSNAESRSFQGRYEELFAEDSTFLELQRIERKDSEEMEMLKQLGTIILSFVGGAMHVFRPNIVKPNPDEHYDDRNFTLKKM